MATIDTISQAIEAKNTGLPTKALDPKNIVGALIVPRKTTISASNALALQTYLQGLANNDVNENRLYPVGNFVEFKDNSEKSVKQSFGYGSRFTVRDGIYIWQFQFVKGGKGLNDALRTFNGSDWDYFFVDSKNVLYGYLNNGKVQSIPNIENYTDPMIINDGKKVTEYTIEFVFSPKYLNELGAVIADSDFDIMDNIYGLQDVNLAVTANATSKKYNITVKSKLNQDIGALYSGSGGLAQASLWTAVVTATGVVLTVSSVAWDAATSSFLLTLGATGYPSAGTITFNLVGPTELSTGGVAGFESTGSVACTFN
jgi:hypothetical protein